MFFFLAKTGSERRGDSLTRHRPYYVSLVWRRVGVDVYIFTHVYFPASSGQAVVVTGFIPYAPGAACLQCLLRARGSVNPTVLVVFSSSVANSRSRAFRRPICAQVKVPANIYEYTRLEDNLIRPTGATGLGIQRPRSCTSDCAFGLLKIGTFG